MTFRLILAASAIALGTSALAAQPTTTPSGTTPATPATPADPSTGTSATPATPAEPATPASPAVENTSATTDQAAPPKKKKSKPAARASEDLGTAATPGAAKGVRPKREKEPDAATTPQ